LAERAVFVCAITLLFALKIDCFGEIYIDFLASMGTQKDKFTNFI
jgi:hypothetical protein